MPHIASSGCAGGAALSTRNVDVIRPPRSSLVCTRDKCIVIEEHLPVQMSRPQNRGRQRGAKRICRQIAPVGLFAGTGTVPIDSFMRGGADIVSEL